MLGFSQRKGIRNSYQKVVGSAVRWLRSEFQKDQGKSALIFPFPGKPVRLTAVVISHKRQLFLNEDDDGF